MSKTPKKKPMERREGIIGTARWLEAAANIAEDEGLKDVTVKIKDLRELIGFMVAVEHIQIRESATVRLGYCRSDQAREMKEHKTRSIKTIICKTPRYDTEVFIGQLPPLVALDGDQQAMNCHSA